MKHLNKLRAPYGYPGGAVGAIPIQPHQEVSYPMKKFILASAAAAALAITAIAPAIASADTPIKVTPANPVVDDLVTVSWKVTKPLKPGWHYEVSITATPAPTAVASSTRTPSATPPRARP